MSEIFVNGVSIIPTSVQNSSGSLVFFPPGISQSEFADDTDNLVNASGSVLMGTFNNDLEIKNPKDSLTFLYLSSSGTSPRIGIGNNEPLTSLDIRSITSSAPANIILRTNEDGVIQVGEETGRVIFAIESSSFRGTKFISSGSTAAIFSKVLGSNTNGAFGSLVFQVNDDSNVTEPIEAMTIGYGLGPSPQEVGFVVSGSMEIAANSNQFRIVSTINGNELARLGFQAGEGVPFDRCLFTLSDDGSNTVRLNTHNNFDFINTGQNLAIGTNAAAPEKLTVEGSISASGDIIGIINGGTF